MIQTVNILKRSAHKYKPYKPSWRRWGLEAIEQEAKGLSSQLSDLLVAVQVQVALCSTELRTEEEALVKAYPQQLRRAGWRAVEWRCTSGHSVKVKARGSLAEAQPALASQGKELDIKTVRTLSRRMAQRRGRPMRPGIGR